MPKQNLLVVFYSNNTAAHNWITCFPRILYPVRVTFDTANAAGNQ